jgi:hypothetical protein
MKKFILACCPLAFSIALSAQPLISTNEYYHIGDVINLINCDAGTLSAGSSGAAMSWNFSSLTNIGTLVMTVARDTTTAYTSNLLITLPNGDLEHMMENNTDSYVYAIEKSGTSVIMNYNNLDIDKRPLTYNDTYTDTFRDIIVTPATHGTGIIIVKADAYGTIQLPTGTYSNVLRVRKYQYEVDTISGGGTTESTITSYLWFDSVHSAPLFEMDSINASTGFTYEARYLASDESVPTRNMVKENFNGCIQNNELILNGGFINGVVYEVKLYNIMGSILDNSEFISSGSAQATSISSQIIPGIYLVGISQKDNPSSQQIIKVAAY